MPEKICSTDGCTRRVLARQLCASHYSAWHRRQRKYTITCAACGAEAQASRKHAKCCSLECWNTEQLQDKERRAIQGKLPVLYRGATRQPQASHLRTNRRLTSGQCRICNKWFVSLHLDVTCSSECKVIRDRESRRQHKDRRRAVKRDAYRADVHRRRVFEADGYRCHLCRRKTDSTKAAPHPRSPTIDHVIPISRGGTHEPANCRTACFQCNATKGDRGGGEQLLLLAV
jgi:5-methylcytosine-specific restriction endonuclease McrA